MRCTRGPIGSSLPALLLAVALLAAWSPPAAARPVVAYIDSDDRYTSADGLSAWLPSVRRVRAVDVADALRRGRLGLTRSRVFFVGSFVTADVAVRDGLHRAASRIRRFLARGGTVVVLAQADEDAAALTWLPRGLGATRGERDAAALRLVRPHHPLLSRPHRLQAEDLAGWEIDVGRPERASSVVSVTDAFDSLVGFQTVATVDANEAYPAIAVATLGKGRVVLVQMAPDRVAAAGKSPRTRRRARRLLENLLNYGLRRHRAARGRYRKTLAPDPPFRRPPPARFRGLVFRDDDGDGVRDEGEPGLPDVAVTNAFRVRRTDRQGRFSFAVELAEPGWVAVTVPDGYTPTTPWYVDSWALPERGRFGLRPVVVPAGPLVIAQLTDIHIGAKPIPVGIEMLREALETVRAAQPPVGAVVVTGDLTASGSPTELVAYRDAFRDVAVPVLHAMGNHDLTRGPDKGATYLRTMGPWAYDREIRGFRFVVLYEQAVGHPATLWARERIADSSLPVILVAHHRLRRSLLDKLLTPKVRVVLSGDWHDAEVFPLAHDAVEVNSAPTSMGGWDHSPPAVRFVRVDAKGRVATALRYQRLPKYLAVVLPERETAGAVPMLLVQAYDSLARVSGLRFGIEGDGLASPLTGELEACGTFAWCGAAPELSPGRYRLTARAVARDGRSWSRSRDFRVSRGDEAPRRARRPRRGSWPVFRGDAARRGHALDELTPPLRVRWAAPTGGEVYAGGPVVEDGVVVLATMDRATVGARNAGVSAFDAADGTLRWRYRSGSSVRHSPAIAGGLVVFQQTDGTAVALEVRSGDERWRYVLADETPSPHAGYYAMAGPLVHQGRVYLGFAAAPRVLDLETGRLLATGPALDAGSAVTYASPVLAGSLVVWPTRHRGLHAFRARPGADGRLRAAWNSRRLRLSASPVVDGQTIFAQAHDGLYLVRARRGSVRRRLRVPAGTSAASPLVSRRTAFVAAGDGSVVALDRRSGAERWRFRTGPALLDFLLYKARGRGNSSSPLLSGIFLYFGSHDGHVYALDARTGTAVWSFDAGIPVPSAPAIADGRLYIADFGGVLLAFGPAQE